MTQSAKDDDLKSVTALLAELNRGNREAASELFNLLYPELRRMARRYFAPERANHTLQPTALVNEAYPRLMAQNGDWQNRAHFLATAATVMRHILVDEARRRNSGKRGGPRQQITLGEALAFAYDKPIDILALEEAMQRLAIFDPRQCRAIELNFYGGLSIEEVAHVLGYSERTAKRDLQMAKRWLKLQLEGGSKTKAAG